VIYQEEQKTDRGATSIVGEAPEWCLRLHLSESTSIDWTSRYPTTHGPGYGVSLLTPKFLLYLNTSGSKYGTSGETGNCLEQGSMFTVRSAQL